MSDCCVPTEQRTTSGHPCPVCGTSGRAVQVITVKSLLIPEALATLEPDLPYWFCPDPRCDVVYFNETGTYRTDQVKVAVFQKDAGEGVSVCYCFGWTRKRIRTELLETGRSTAVDTISGHLRAGRCGCEVNNPQGSCCLGNVRSVIQSFQKP